MRLFLGVDGGGTKTDFLLIDESGRALAERHEGSAYYPEIGVDALQAMFVRGIRGTLAQASASPVDVTYACLGVPAYGEDGSLIARLDEIAAAALPTQRYRCVNDMVCGWAAALAGRDGINIVAGTGSIGYGEFETRSARAGGWGELFGDEGSAYWVAREALNLFSRMSDGRAKRAPLYALVREHFEVPADFDSGTDLDSRADFEVCAAVYGPPPMTRSELAAVAPLVSRAAGAGDLEAKRILEKAGAELAAIVHAVRGRLGVPPQAPLPVSYCGGMFRHDSLFTALFEDALRMGEPRYEFAAPQLVPRAGAALYAAKLAGTPLTPQAVAQLTSTHGAGHSGDED